MFAAHATHAAHPAHAVYAAHAAFASYVARSLAMMSIYGPAIVGGVLVGLSAVGLLLVQGRIAGVSGVLGGLLEPGIADRAWRLAFLGGLLLVGLVTAAVAPSALGAPLRSLPLVAIAGALVGFGARMGGGCTSGHGICGLGRFAPRSAVAVATFLVTGMATATIAGAWS